MSSQFVVDASALAKSFLDQDGSAAFREWMHEVLASGDKLVAPDLLDYEIASVITREFGDLEVAEQALLHEVALRYVARVRPAATESLGLARSTGLTAYDAAYLALAHLKGSPLVTGDAALLRAAAALGIRTIKH